MSFVISALPVEAFSPLFGLSKSKLAARRVERRIVDAPIGYPCRVTLEDAPVGETVLLLNYEHQPAETPYRSAYAIFVREAAKESARFEGALPAAIVRRAHISLRAFSPDGHLISAEVSPGAEAHAVLERLLVETDVGYVHLHNAAYGCYLARADRA